MNTDTAVADQPAVLDPTDPGSWARLSSETLFAFPQSEVEDAQLAALQHRFGTLRTKIDALDNLATKQGVDRIGSFAEAPPVLFDHRVLKSYPLSLIEQRRFDRMTGWLQRLTTNDLSSVDVAGIDSLDDWLVRLGDHGMSVGHTTGTSGKLSFLPRSLAEWPNFSNSYFEMQRALLGFDVRTEKLPTFVAAVRRGHYWLGVVLGKLYSEQIGRGGDTHQMYHYDLSADLISLAGRLQAADEKGQLGKLEIPEKLLRERAALMEASNRRDEDVENWLRELSEYRGQRVVIQGVAADLVRAMLKGEELGISLELAPDTILVPGGGMKGMDVPADWEERMKRFFCVDRTYKSYGMTECLGYAPGCEHGFYHLYPYTIPILLDENFEVLPREGVQTGRYAFFDLLPETYWGGYVTGDRVTMHWDSDCPCGRQGPRVAKDIVRFSELEGVQDDKISCAGTAEAYSAFMDFISEI
jgi:hypothetical protein